MCSMMKISRFLKILEDLVALKFSDSKGKHGRRFYRNLHRILRAFLLQDGLSLKTKLHALTASVAVYTKVRIHEQIVSEDGNKCVQFIVLDAARILLETEFLKLKENDPSRSLFVQTVQQTKCSLKSSLDGRLFEALDKVLLTKWSHPVLLKMLQQEHSDSEKIPYAAFIESIESPDIVRLRVRMLLESGCHELADNLVSWCVASRMFDDDAYVLLRRLDFLHTSDREEHFHQLCQRISCCTARKLLESAKEGTVICVDPSTILTMSRTFLLLDWIKITDLSCTKELLRQWLALEYEHLNKEHRLAIAAFNKVIALANSVRKLVLFVDVLESQFGEVFRTFCSELMEQAIRQERHRLNCARLYRKDAEDARYATESLLAICRILGRLYKDHCQMNLSCRLCCLYLDPNVKDFCSLETKYTNLKSPPSTEPAPPPQVCPSAYRSLLSAMELLRPESFALSSSWVDLKPVLVGYIESAGFSYNWTKNRFKSWQKRVESGMCLGRKRMKMWKGMKNASAADGSKTKSLARKGQAKVGNGFVKRNGVRTDLAKSCHIKKELKVSPNSNKRKQNSKQKCGVTSQESGRDFAWNEHKPRKMRRLDSVAHPKHVTQLLSGAVTDGCNVARESAGESSTDSGAVSETSAGTGPLLGSEMQRKSLVARRYVRNSHSCVPASPASTSDPPKFSSLDGPTLGISDKEAACRVSRECSKNSELYSTCFRLNSNSAQDSLSSCIESCSNSSSNQCCSTVGKLDKNSNLNAMSVNAFSANAFSRNLCSSTKTLKTDIPKVKCRASSLSAWESTYLAYCSSVSENEVDLEKDGKNFTVATTNLALKTADLILVATTSDTSVFSTSSTMTVLSSSTAERGMNSSRSGFLENLPPLKVVDISEIQTMSLTTSSCKSSEPQLAHSHALNLTAKNVETSVSIVSENQNALLKDDSSTSVNLSNVTPNPTTVEDFGLNDHASVMTDAHQSPSEAVTPVAALDDMVSGSVIAPHNSFILVSDCGVELPAPSVLDTGSTAASSRMESCSTVVRLPTTSAAECGRKVALDTDLVVETSRELSTVSDLRCEISETPVSQSLCARKIQSPSIQGGILQSDVPVSTCTSKFEMAAKDVCSSEEPVAAKSTAIFSVSPSVACTSIAPSLSTSTQSLVGLFQKEALNVIPEVQTSTCSVFPKSELAIVSSVSVSLDSRSNASSYCTHPSMSLPVEATVIMTTASDDSSTSSIIMPAMSIPKDVLSAAAEPQITADSVATHELGLESVLPITATDTMLSIDHSPAAAPDSATYIKQTAVIIADDVCLAAAPVYDIVTGSNETYQDTPEASDNLPVLPQDVMEMLETVGQKVTCSKKKRHSADFVQRLWKLLKRDSENSSSSGSPSSSRGSDVAEMSVELNAFERNKDPEGLQTSKVLAVDAIVNDKASQLSESLGFAENSVNDGLNDLQSDQLPDGVSKTVCDSYKKVCISKASVSRNLLSAEFQDNHKQVNSFYKKFSEVDNSSNIHAEQAFSAGTNSTSDLRTDGGHDTKTDHLMDMSMFNAPENQQHLLLYNSFRQEHERNQDNRRTLAVIHHDDETVPVSPTNLFYYEKACPKIRDMLTDHSPGGFDSQTDHTLSNTTNMYHSWLSLREEKPLAILSTPVGGGGLVEGGENNGQDLSTEPAADEEPQNEVRGAAGYNFDKGQGHAGDSPDKGQGHGDNSDKTQGHAGDNPDKGHGHAEGNPDRCHRTSSELVAGDEVICILCDKSLSSDRGLRIHLLKVHELDFVNRRKPEEGYRCRLCDRRTKILAMCTCRHKNTYRKTSDGAISLEKSLEDSSQVSSCCKREARRSDDRKVSPDVSSGCNSSSRRKSNSLSKDRLNRGNSSSQSREKSSSQNKSVASSSTNTNLGNGGSTEGSTDRRSRKRFFDDSKQSSDNSSTSSYKKRSAGKSAGRAERSIKCRSRKRLFDEDRRKTDNHFAHRTRTAGEHLGQVKASRTRRRDLKDVEHSSQINWQLRDRLKVKTV